MTSHERSPFLLFACLTIARRGAFTQETSATRPLRWCKEVPGAVGFSSNLFWFCRRQASTWANSRACFGLQSPHSQTHRGHALQRWPWEAGGRARAARWQTLHKLMVEKMYDQWHFTCFNLKTGVRTSNIIIVLYFPPSIWQICRICRGFTNTSHLVYNRKPKPQSVAKCCLKSSRVGQLPQKCWGTFIWKHAWLPWSKSKAIRKMARSH